MMRKALLAVVLAVLLLTSTALAGVYEGTTIAASSISVEAATGGRLIRLNAMVGGIVQEGDVIGTIRTTRVFATQDGTVARIITEEGEMAEGTVLELYPVEKYRIHCTVDKAHQSTESTLVRSGEQIYIKCTNDGTHRGVGLITKIDGNEFMTLAIGGELYVGETVYLYRDTDFTKAQRVGIGTVETNATEVYEADGKIVRIHVTEGEYVERGELLYELIEEDGTYVTASASGIVTEIAVSQGDAIEKNQTLMTIVPQSQICVEITMDEAAAAETTVGEKVELIYAADPTETPVAGTVIDVSYIAENKSYAVRIQPESTDELRLGMTVTVRTDTK